MNERAPIRLRVRVDGAPEPALLRAAVEASLRGAAAAYPEAAVGDAVAKAVARALADASDTRSPQWR